MKLLQYGAGNIGRSFVAQLFSRAGYEVVFVDIDEVVVKALNERKKYKIEVKDIESETILIDNVRAVHGKDTRKVAEEIATCDIMATAVGPNSLPFIYENVAKGLLKRRELTEKPLDIIICENLRNAAEAFRKGLSRYLPKDYPMDSLVGLVETSIGKMVPIMPEEVKKRDPLVVYAEAYNELICDKLGFKGKIPAVPGLMPKENIKAYVDRKLFVHNLGHSITAWLGYLVNPNYIYIWQAIENEQIRKAVRGAMWESGEALIKEYPQEFNKESQGEHIEDLIRRFANRALGDTIYRVGRDLSRKLSPEERLMGALRLDMKHNIPAPFTILGVGAAMLFRATDEHGKLFEKDYEFVNKIYSQGINYVLVNICGLKPRKREDKRLLDEIKRATQFILSRGKIGAAWLKYFDEYYFDILYRKEG